MGGAIPPTTVPQYRYFLYVDWIAYTMQFGLSERSGDLWLTR